VKTPAIGRGLGVKASAGAVGCARDVRRVILDDPVGAVERAATTTVRGLVGPVPTGI
jgi:hypothetical protein